MRTLLGVYAIEDDFEKQSHLWDLNPRPALYESGQSSYETQPVLASCLASSSATNPDADLQKIIVAWPKLPKKLRQALLLMADVDHE